MGKKKGKKINRGKKFEKQFYQDWLTTFPRSFIYRLADKMSKFKKSSNPCDFIASKSGKIFLAELKSIYGNTLNFANIKQYGSLISYKDTENVFPCIIIWFIDWDKVVYIKIKEIERMKKDGKKSVNIKMLEEKEYGIIEIPSIKKRVFLKSDYTILNNLGVDI